MNNGYCEKHEWSHGMGRRCPDCVELEAVTNERDSFRGALVLLDDMLWAKGLPKEDKTRKLILDTLNPKSSQEGK